MKSDPQVNAPRLLHKMDFRHGEAWLVALFAGFLSLCLVGLLEYWLLRPHQVGSLSFHERLKLFPKEEGIAITTAWQCGWGCGLAVTIGILLLAQVRANPRRRFIERKPRMALGFLYGFIAGFWVVMAITDPGDLSDRLLGSFHYGPSLAMQLARCGPPLCGLICAVMVGVHVSLIFSKGPKRVCPPKSQGDTGLTDTPPDGAPDQHIF